MPEILREAMSSEANSDIVWKTAENEHLPEDKIMVVSRLVGYVLMGFVHPEDLARELHDNLGIDSRIAASIAEPINKKIFQPLREELETIYSPAASEVEAPATVDSINSPQEEGGQTESPKPVLMDSTSSPQVDSISSVPKFFQTGQIPKPVAPMPTPPAPTPKPATKPVSALNQFSVSRPVPPVTPDATVSAPSPLRPSSGQASPPQQDYGQAGSTSSPQAGQAAPFMLHMESKAQPLSPSKPGFKIGLSEEQFGKMEQKWTAPPRPAQIETGFVPQPKPISSSRPVGFSEQGKGESSARVVHYNEMKTPIAPTPRDKEILPSKVVQTAPLPPTLNKVAMSMPKPPMPEKLKIPVPPAAQEKMLSEKPLEKELLPPRK
ncbi:MAG: hypothetical protein Q8Q17_01675 [bacterium]|nr:hypothetical protein [bacterium]